MSVFKQIREYYMIGYYHKNVEKQWKKVKRKMARKHDIIYKIDRHDLRSCSNTFCISRRRVRKRMTQRQYVKR